MFSIINKLFTLDTAKAARKNRSRGLQLESLEERAVPAVVASVLSQTTTSGTTKYLSVQGDSAANTITVRESAGRLSVDGLQIRVGTRMESSIAATSVKFISVKGEGSNDRIDLGTVRSVWGDLKGGTGDDVMIGGSAGDFIYGEVGNDQLIGRGGNDWLSGGDNNDVLIAIDAGTGDTIDSGSGNDTLWADMSGTVRDRVWDSLGTGDKLQEVAFFSNSADRTLDGDRITDPITKSGHTHRRFSNNPLFSSSGPSELDIKQGKLANCYLMAGLGAIAYDSPQAIRHNIVDFGDGTYGVRLGNNFYRVDDDLAVVKSTDTTPAYAALGRGNSMWVAVAEKAFAHYRTGANTYASTEWGWSVEVNRAFGSTSAGEKEISSYASDSAMANDIYSRWQNYQAVTIGFVGEKKVGSSTAPIITGHQYIVRSVTRNSAGVVTSITLRNPWGVDGAGNDGNNDGLVTLTPAQIRQFNGRVNWGRV